MTGWSSPGLVLALLGAASLGACGASADDDGGQGRAVGTADPARTFAPVVVLHHREERLPISADRFIDWSTFKWSQEGCSYEIVAIGAPRRRAGIDPGDHPALVPGRLGGDPRPYRIRPPVPDDCSKRSRRSYASDQHTRPFDRGRPAGLRGTSGFHLDLATDELEGVGSIRRGGDGRPVLSGVPAYYVRVTDTVAGEPGLRLVYWLLYGSTAPPGDASLGRHEGGWERVDVLVTRAGRGRYRPQSVRYHVPGGVVETQWTDVDRVDDKGRPSPAGSHPVALAARGTHTPYPAPVRERRVLPTDEGDIAFVEDSRSCRDCPLWRTWTTLLDARRQPWYGYGGGWGTAYDASSTSGPLGPSPFTGGS